MNFIDLWSGVIPSIHGSGPERCEVAYQSEMTGAIFVIRSRSLYTAQLLKNTNATTDSEGLLFCLLCVKHHRIVCPWLKYYHRDSEYIHILYDGIY